ncbi:uroporphyrinogen-III synthase [Salisediminibacterium beveridgei]|uniref:Uroporphyrinogen-III synthase n=1 Tax=Salisediminibacterium beveridgei TaxID=632773 RepID=A0A1D7QTN2_9BACI|nr:uroporphyrinogen-III synthase [Salisediminibacterium beveridgei]AOM82335.1 Uroporphyrinogen-III methyltransferase / Uroporphyrinogen-III synthase [Salisediminibacterium beveridgei]
MTTVLKGLTVMNTRACHQQGTLSRLLMERGATVIEMPLIRVEPVNGLDPSVFYNACQEADVIIFTSVNAVNAVLDLLNPIVDRDFMIASLRYKRIAAVGSKTESALKKLGIEPEIVPARFDAEHLAEAVVNATSVKERILYPKSKRARSTLHDLLKTSGRQLTEVPVYNTVEDWEKQKELISVLENDACDVVTFASPSAVHSFFHQAAQMAFAKNLMFAVIGRVTEEALSGYVDPSRIITPDTYTIEGLVGAIQEYKKSTG